MKKILVLTFLLLLNISSAMGKVSQSYQCTEQKITSVKLDSTNDEISNYQFQFTWLNNEIKQYHLYGNEIEEYTYRISDQGKYFFTTSDYGSDYTVIERFDSSSNLLSLVTLQKNEVEVSLAHCHPIEEITLTSNNIDEEPLSSQIEQNQVEPLSSKIAGVFVDALIDTFSEKKGPTKEDIEEFIARGVEENADIDAIGKELNIPKEYIISLKKKKAEILAEKERDTTGEENFNTIYYEFAGTFTTNLANSRKMLQLGLAVSTQYDDTVMVNVEAHELGLRSVILERIGNFSEDDIKGEEGRRLLATSIKDALNAELEELGGSGGIEKVHFTSFVMQ